MRKFKVGIEIEDEFISKEEIQEMTMSEVKMVLSFIESEKELMKLAIWHSEEAIDYVQELLRTCN